MHPVDAAVLLARRIRKGHVGQPRDQVAGRADRVHRLFALGHVPGDASQFDREDESIGMHGQRLQISGL